MTIQNPDRQVIPFRAAVSVNDFCAANSIGRTMFYKLLKQGRIRVIKVGRRTLIPLQEVSAWLDRSETDDRVARLAN